MVSRAACSVRGSSCLYCFSVETADPCAPTAWFALEELDSVSFIFFHRKHSKARAQAHFRASCDFAQDNLGAGL
jgi:hypothetical protein